MSCCWASLSVFQCACGAVCGCVMRAWWCGAVRCGVWCGVCVERACCGCHGLERLCNFRFFLFLVRLLSFTQVCFFPLQCTTAAVRTRAAAVLAVPAPRLYLCWQSFL